MNITLGISFSETGFQSSDLLDSFMFDVDRFPLYDIDGYYMLEA